MAERGEILTHGEKSKIVQALRAIQRKVSWKAGKDLVHLKKRQRMGHILPSASISDYEQIILDIVREGNNVVYLYELRDIHYYAIRGFSGAKEWLIIFGEGGLMETAFPPEDMDEYLGRRGFALLGQIGEIRKWTGEAKS